MQEIMNNQGQNEIAQAPPAQDNQKAEKVTAGGCLPRPCSACGEELSEHAVIVKNLRLADAIVRGGFRDDVLEGRLKVEWV